MKGDDWTMAHSTATQHHPPGLRSTCPGTFRVEENDGKRPATVVCDECGAAMAVRQSELTGPTPATSTEPLAF